MPNLFFCIMFFVTLVRSSILLLSCFYHSQLGEGWDINPDVYDQIDAFTCTMYGHARETSVNAVRSKMLKKMVGEGKGLDNNSKVDSARLPPCQDSLVPHTNRVNHRVACFKKANFPIFERPKPYDEHQGWSLDEHWVLESLWTRGSVLPQTLIDLLDGGIDGDEDEEEEEEDMEMDECDFDEENDD